MNESVIGAIIGYIAGTLIVVPILLLWNYLEYLAPIAKFKGVSLSQYLLLHILPQRFYAKLFPHQFHRLVTRELYILGWDVTVALMKIDDNFITELHKHFSEISGNHDPVSAARRDQIVDYVYGHFMGRKTLTDIANLCRELGVGVELLPDDQFAIDFLARQAMEKEFQALCY